MKKKLLSLLLAFSLTLSAVGCQNKEQTGGADAADTADAAQKQLQVIDDNYRTYYEVFLYSFYDSDGDGIGDINGLIEKLDYINDGDDTTDTDLGCNGIWLMPVMPSTTYHKYDVTDYYDIDPEYGTLEDFENLIAECHDRGINVIIDFVMNHTSSQHEWFQEACAYLESLGEDEEPDISECPYVDYYNFSRERMSGGYEVEGTDWYYEAPFWSEMPDLNLGSDAVRAELEDIVEFWLDLGVDGFRLDAAKEYYSASTESNIEVLSWFNGMVKEKKPDAYIVAEVWTSMETYVRYYESGIDSCFNFAFADSTGIIASCVKGVSGASAYGKAIVSFQDAASEYSDSYIDAPFYTNHDMGRSAGYYAGDYSENQTKIAQAMNLLMSGSAFLYYGEELGMKGSGADENKRAPMYWSEDSSAEGMCTGPAGMDSIKMKYASYEEQAEDENSIYNFVKAVIRLRNTYPEIARGTVIFEEELSDDDICVLRKTYGDEELMLVFCLSQETASIDLSGIAVGSNDTPTIVDMLLTGDEEARLDGSILEMPAYSVVVLK